MSTESPVFGSVHVDLTDADARIHTVHNDGELSVALTPSGSNVDLYLTGTPDELHWLCDKLRAIVTAHESQTTLAGEAAREVLTPLTAEVVRKWHGYTETEWSALGSDTQKGLHATYDDAMGSVTR